MIQLELGPDEARIMREILESYLSDLRLEIADTEKKAFRDELHKKENFIKSVVERLSAA